MQARSEAPGLPPELCPPAAVVLIPPTLPDPGVPGASALREYERRHQKREHGIEQKWGRLASVVKFFGDDPQSTTAWAKGSAPSGVWVIDAKNYQGKVERRDLGGWSKVDNRLYVAGRNRSRLVEGLAWQIDAVKAALDDNDVFIHAALCFTDASWKLFAKPFRIGNVWVTWADALAELIGAPGPLVREDVLRVAKQLGATLRSAAPVAPAARSS